MIRLRIWLWLIGLMLMAVLALGWGEQPSFASTLTGMQPVIGFQGWGSDRLRSAQILIRSLPQSAEGYSQLASAYLLKSRETGDFSYATKAQSALERALELAPQDESALKLQLVLLLTAHEFQAAYDRAQAWSAHFPADPQVETALVDALVELGDYAKANAMVQKLVNEYPNAIVYARLSYLKSLQGDQAGAIAAMRQAVRLANPRDREGLAWYHVHLGTELLNAGQREAGEQTIDQALQIFPEYPLALSAKARARLTAGDSEQAVAFYQRSLAQMPLPDTAMMLGDLQQHLGHPKAAQQQYDLVDFLVQTGGEPFRKAYAHQLVLFWADHNQHLDEALSLIQQERLTRSDIYTFDALAWCLFKLKRLSAARAAIDQALRLHTPDARILYHAGQIYHASAAPTLARQFFQQALALNPAFHPQQADRARQMLAPVQDP
jgi:tetratricopeptide (TPR) repeat protein